MQERRQHSRHACVIKVYYLVRGSWYRGSIQNISEEGVYIRSIQKEKFSEGEAILMLIELRVLRDQIRGKIIRLGSDGIAVAFHTSEPEYTELKAFNKHAIICTSFALKYPVKEQRGTDQERNCLALSVMVF